MGRRTALTFPLLPPAEKEFTCQHDALTRLPNGDAMGTRGKILPVPKTE